MNRSSAFLAAALLLATPGSAFAAEKAKAPFEVIVSSPEGAPVIDADVAISSATTVVPYSFAGKTDAAGKCTGELVEFKGLYSIKVVKEGYKEFTQDLDFETTKFKKGELATIKVSLPKIPAADYYNAGAKDINSGNFAAAQANFEKATAADPLLAIAHSALAQAHMAQADPAWLQKKKAEGALDAGLDLAAESKRHAEKVRTPATAVLLYNAGAQASNSKDPDKAKLIETSRRYFRLALDINPNLYQAHNGLAELAIREEKFEDAVTELSKVVELSPRNFKAYERRIEVLKKIGDKDRVAAAEQELAKLKAGG